MNNTERPPRKKLLEKFLSFDLPWNVMSPIWKREFITSLNGFDIRYPILQDAELNTRALLKDNVRYKIFANAEPCCFYRISNERKKSSIANQQQIHLQGIIMYIENMSSLLKKHHKEDKLKYLRGTVFSMVIRLKWLLTKGEISKQEVGTIMKNLFISLSDYPGIFKKFHQQFLLVYMKLYDAGCHKIKGFNFLSKKMYIHLF